MVVSWTAGVLRGWAYRMQFETLRAVALDCHPWHSQLWVSILTENEIPRVRETKWEIGDWRWAQTEPVGDALATNLAASYEQLKTSSETDALDPLFLTLANCLVSQEVAEALKRYTVADDFELAVFNPDSPSLRNYVLEVGR